MEKMNEGAPTTNAAETAVLAATTKAAEAKAAATAVLEATTKAAEAKATAAAVLEATTKAAPAEGAGGGPGKSQPQPHSLDQLWHNGRVPLHLRRAT